MTTFEEWFATEYGEVSCYSTLESDARSAWDAALKSQENYNPKPSFSDACAECGQTRGGHVVVDVGHKFKEKSI